MAASRCKASWGPARRDLGAWQVGGIASLRAEFPFEVSFPGDLQNSGTLHRGNRIGAGGPSKSWIDNWFDQAAFVISEPGAFGNSGPNVLIWSGVRSVDFVLGERFRIPSERHTPQFRFEAFNLTNSPRFGQPAGMTLRASTGTNNRADEPRRIQCGLKYVFRPGRTGLLRDTVAGGIPVQWAPGRGSGSAV